MRTLVLTPVEVLAVMMPHGGCTKATGSCDATGAGSGSGDRPGLDTPNKQRPTLKNMLKKMAASIEKVIRLLATRQNFSESEDQEFAQWLTHAWDELYYLQNTIPHFETQLGIHHPEAQQLEALRSLGQTLLLALQARSLTQAGTNKLVAILSDYLSAIRGEPQVLTPEDHNLPTDPPGGPLGNTPHVGDTSGSGDGVAGTSVGEVENTSGDNIPGSTSGGDNLTVGSSSQDYEDNGSDDNVYTGPNNNLSPGVNDVIIVLRDVVFRQTQAIYTVGTRLNNMASPGFVNMRVISELSKIISEELFSCIIEVLEAADHALAAIDATADHEIYRLLFSIRKTLLDLSLGVVQVRLLFARAPSNPDPENNVHSFNLSLEILRESMRNIYLALSRLILRSDVEGQLEELDAPAALPSVRFSFYCLEKVARVFIGDYLVIGYRPIFPSDTTRDPSRAASNEGASGNNRSGSIPDAPSSASVPSVRSVATGSESRAGDEDATADPSSSSSGASNSSSSSSITPPSGAARNELETEQAGDERNSQAKGQSKGKKKEGMPSVHEEEEEDD
jgi:hypothetical protein